MSDVASVLETKPDPSEECPFNPCNTVSFASSFGFVGSGQNTTAVNLASLASCLLCQANPYRGPKLRCHEVAMNVATSKSHHQAQSGLEDFIYGASRGRSKNAQMVSWSFCARNGQTISTFQLHLVAWHVHRCPRYTYLVVIVRLELTQGGTCHILP